MTNGSGDRKRAGLAPVPAGPATRPTPLRPGLPAPAPPVAPMGFRAELNGASLWDLVQMECLARTRRVVQVSGEGGIGYLYFDGGKVIHAVTPRLSGQAAALEILGWTNGAFHPCDRTWPRVATIESSHESLILLAAKRLDEAAASNLLAFRGRAEIDAASDDAGQALTDAAFEMVEAAAQEIEEEPMADIRIPNNNQSATPVPITRNEPLPEFSVMMRVAGNGAIVKNKGGSEELAGVVAYTQRLVELVGELLGLDRFAAMECTFKESEGQTTSGQSRCLVFSEANGDVVALRPRAESNIQPLRESLGL